MREHINKNWPGLERVEAVNQDFLGYLSDILKQAEKPKEVTIKRKLFLSYLTDHPKSLLEIGKYPIPTYQNYELKGELNKKLLGYVFDAHIKAVLVKKVELEKDTDIEILNKSEIQLDENKETILIKTPDKKEIQGKISKSVTRRIII